MLDKTNGNWVKISREVFYHELADDKPWSRLATWIFLVAMASTGERTVQFRGHSYILTRGQLSISLGDLEEKTGWSRGRVRCFFSYLKRKQMANTSGDPFCTLVTILNYDKWQGTNCQAVIGKKNDIASSIANDIASSIANDSTEAVEGCTNNIVHDIASSIANDQQNKNVFKNVSRVVQKTEMSPEVSEVLAYLNEKVKRNFKVPGDIPARLKDYSVKDCKTVIDKKCKEWLGTDLARHLDPVTLFRPSNFDRYLNQVEGTGNKAIFKEWVKGHPDLDWHRFGEDNQYARACTYLLAFKAAEKSGQVQFETGDLEAQQLAIQIKTEETQKSIRGGKR